VEPVLHLSFAVRDLDEARAFYVDGLGCKLGRVRDGWIDVWFYGMQVTLHELPSHVDDAPDDVRHFGVTLPHEELHALVRRLDGRGVTWMCELATDYPGTRREQTKCKVIDPSGNVIEFKSYKDPGAAFAND
jgi:extradiol dioxygenase family protein